MTTIRLRAESEAALIEALPWARQDGGWVLATHQWALDVIGPIVTTPGTYDEDFVELTPPITDSRFHANLMLLGGFAPEIPDGLIVTPSNPLREFAA